ncbi:MAG: hypothetical protein GY810_12080 [Aureispira sp.]|nr:hypothetical protein [Aureispira sp.]
MNNVTEPKDNKKTIYIVAGVIGAIGLIILLYFMLKPSPPPPEVDKKPIIYLYPEQKTTVNVQLDYQGELTTTYPKYDASKGWIVEAQPNGTLVDPITQKEYYGLYWEGKDSYQYDLSKGFVVQGEDAADFLDEKLETLGLNRREANEFIVYWLPILEQNEYNFIHFAQEEYTQRAELNITPTPETFIRLLMCFKSLASPINIEPQELKAPQRKGFTVVEWGGREVGQNILQ